jgi:hypothetical protein
MRNFAPSILFASITALMGGSAFAATDDIATSDTDTATGSPTVDTNTTDPQGMSYSDKSNTSPGTNARMDRNTSARTDIDIDRDIDMTARPPFDSTNGAAANSTTGTSPGR